MAIHDAYLRRTPLERLIPDDDFVEAHLAAIEAEARSRGIDPGDPGAFAMLDAVGAAVDDLRRPEDPAEQRHQHAVLLYHVRHLVEGGREHRLVTTGVVRAAVETDGGGRDEVEWPEGARYLQLPQHLVWVRASAEDTPASLDGWFETRAGDLLNLLGVVGVTGAGPGFTVLPLPPLPVADAPLWRTETIREGGGDFRSEIPGSELEGLYEMRTAGEMLKLAARIRRWEARNPAGIRTVAAREAAPDPTPPASPPPSDLPHLRLELG